MKDMSEIREMTSDFLLGNLTPKHVPDQPSEAHLAYRSMERTQQHLMMMLLRIEDKLDRMAEKKKSSLLDGEI